MKNKEKLRTNYEKRIFPYLSVVFSASTPVAEGKALSPGIPSLEVQTHLGAQLQRCWANLSQAGKTIISLVYWALLGRL